ncbi:uncharacterized protein LOC6504401 isoform X1 [Drosophila ananassae]|nr:uncharacterized protein LOC6504401 isoform X1 [Drosophila ananassae]
MDSMDLKMELGGLMQSPTNAKRFVVEDSITKVTSDGEPHGMMTMVAGLSGLLAAIIILAVLASMVACRKQRSPLKRKSRSSTNVAMTSVQSDQPQLAGNLNAAFAESTLTLDKIKAQDQDTQWQPTSVVVVERY